jgi:hypothetical protein
MRQNHKSLEPFQTIDTTKPIENEEDCLFTDWETALQKDLKSFWESFNIED